MHLFFRALMPLIWAVTRVFSYKRIRKPIPDGPILVFCNHQTEWDPLFVALLLHRHVYFVCTEDLLSHGLFSRLLQFLLNPIPISKGGMDAGAVRETLRRLHHGEGVAIFPEGELSPDGCTGRIKPSTGRLVRSAKCPLVTLRLQGGGLVSPQWRRAMRIGPVTGEVVGVYSAEKLAAMKPAEIDALLCADLAEDDGARQLICKKKYRGHRLAEGLDAFLFLCPQCGGLRTMKTAGDRIFCSCGLQAEYDVYGFLHGVPEFRTVAEWARWQRETFARRVADAAEKEILLRDEKISVLETMRGHCRKKVGETSLAATRTMLFVGNRAIPFEEIGVIAIRRNSRTLLLNLDGRHLQLTSPDFCGQPYRQLSSGGGRRRKGGALKGAPLDPL